MRNIREVLRLILSLQLSHRQASLISGVARTTTNRYFKTIQENQLSWSDIDTLSDDALRKILCPKRVSITDDELKNAPNWLYVHTEMKRKGVTLWLLWHEYKAEHPEGLSYQAFTRRYRAYRRLLGLSMRQTHKAGEKCFVDYSGMTVPILDQLSGGTTTAQIFVGVLGGSNYSYVEATASQNLQDWVGSHVRMFAFFGALPRILVPDNLKSAVTKACQYDPVINPTYHELAMHYNVAVVPARKYKPKDKAAVEKGVQVAQRWILARLRNHRFYSLHALNEAIKPLVADLNNRQLKRIAASRYSQFVEIDLPEMRPLPSVPFEMAEWRAGLRVGADYHAIVDGYAYSVPYRLAKEKVEARLTQSVIEFFHNGGRVATHERKYQSSGHVTLPSHMPKAHQHYAIQSSEHLLQWAKRVGASTFDVVSHQLESRPHPEAGYRSCLGLQRLARSYSEERLEAACQRAMYINSRSYTSISSILKTNLDQQPLPVKADAALPIEHSNVRGSDYYTGASSC